MVGGLCRGLSCGALVGLAGVVAGSCGVLGCAVVGVVGDVTEVYRGGAGVVGVVDARAVNGGANVAGSTECVGA